MRAEKLARERSQFAAAAAHELRTPLAGLQLYGDMLADGLGDPAKLARLRAADERGGRRGSVASCRTCSGSRSSSAATSASIAQVGALGDALRELAERAEPALDRAGAVLELDVAPELRARFDRDALARIVGNLLDNAEKYARDAEDRTIELVARETADAVEIVVADHGPGVADSTRRLFRPFSRGVAPMAPRASASGSRCRKSLARAMGGELDYRRRDGGGAAFVLRLQSDPR